MEETNISQEQNPLGTAPVGGLIGKFAIPAIISMLVSALYNIVDQIFIGQGVGMLGNAATNVAFPVTTIATALALLLGIGGASNYNLEMGAGREKKASSIAGTALSTLVITGVILAVAVLLFLRPLLSLFGATTDVMPYAVDYLGITAVGLPFYALSIGGNHIVRADRSPTYSMTCVLTGAIINTILDPLFIFGFGWGIKGAALATVIGQVVSGILVIIYFGKFRKMYLEMSMLKPSSECLKAIISLGMASCINQIAMAVVQIVLNNILRYYGGLSVYGSDIPIACVGVISKVNQVFMAICIGISQGCQPIWGFNYGAKKYDRAKALFRQNIRFIPMIDVCMSFIAFLFSNQLMRIFTDDIAIIHTAHYLFLADIAVEAFRGITHMGENSLCSVEDTLYTSIVSIASCFLISVLFCRLFCIHFKMGLFGYYISAMMDEGIRGLMYRIRWNKGKWVDRCNIYGKCTVPLSL